MFKKQSLSHLIEINLAMLFVSTSGVLGRHIDLSPPLTIGFRTLLAFIILWAYCRYRRYSLTIQKKHVLPILFSGLLLGGHWVTYFYSLQLSSVAIGMLSLFTYPVITSFLEPIFLKTKFQKIHLVLGFLVLSGIYLLNPEIDTADGNTIAIALGILSALLYSLRNIILKNRIAEYNGSSLMCIQMIVITLALSPFFFSNEIQEVPGQLPWVFILALLTTAIGHTLFLSCFKHFSITTISILSSVQPIFGIILGVIFLREIPTWATLVGGLLILSAVVIESVRVQKTKSIINTGRT